MRLFFLTLFLSLSIFSCTNISNNKSNGNELYLLIERADGLTNNSDVLYRGLSVGKVVDVKLHNKDYVMAIIKLEDDFKIPKNSIIKLENDLLGTGFFSIEFSNDEEFIEFGDTIIASVPTLIPLDSIFIDSILVGDIETIMNEFSNIAKDFDSVMKTGK